MTRNLLLAFTLLIASSSSVGAQLLVGSGELYGEGVHRYFARDYQGTDELLSRAIEAGSQDPRAYYFRGLAREAFGGGGDMDFEEGSRLEAAGRSGPIIGYSLSRVQGMARIKLEKARRSARVSAAQQRALMQQAAPATSGVPIAPVAPNNPAVDPFKDGEGMRSGDAQPVPEVTDTPKADATTDPFGDEPMTTEPAAPSDDPFGGSTTPATDPDDPFK